MNIPRSRQAHGEIFDLFWNLCDVFRASPSGLGALNTSKIGICGTMLNMGGGVYSEIDWLVTRVHTRSEVAVGSAASKLAWILAPLFQQVACA